MYPDKSTRQLAANGGMPEEALFLQLAAPAAVPQGAMEPQFSRCWDASIVVDPWILSDVEGHCRKSLMPATETFGLGMISLAAIQSLILSILSQSRPAALTVQMMQHGRIDLPSTSQIYTYPD